MMNTEMNETEMNETETLAGLEVEAATMTREALLAAIYEADVAYSESYGECPWDREYLSRVADVREVYAREFARRAWVEPETPFERERRLLCEWEEAEGILF